MLECPRINSFAPSLLTLTPLVIPLRFSHVSASDQGELIGGSNVAWPTQNSWSPPFSFIPFSPCQITSWDLTLARTISLFAHNLNLTPASPFSSIFKSSSDINPLFTTSIPYCCLDPGASCLVSMLLSCTLIAALNPPDSSHILQNTAKVLLVVREAIWSPTFPSPSLVSFHEILTHTLF